MNTDIIYRYIGNGAFVVADIPVPARDIQEWEIMLDPALKAAVEANIINAPGTCFERMEPPPVAKKTSKATVEPAKELTVDTAE